MSFDPKPNWLENACMVVSEVGIIAMAAIVILEIITRNLLGFSFEISEELGGYIIVGIAFLSLPVCQAYRSYHHVVFVQARLSPRMRVVSHLAFDVLSLAFCLILLWQLSRFVVMSFRTGDQAATPLGTPLWIPQAVMPLGVLVASLSLMRAIIGHWRQLRRTGG
jgi:TRAP-type C4-dicarboxylate transport system permease small subunit